MKRIFLSALSLLTVISFTASANDATKPGPGIEEVFQKEFAGAQKTTWSFQDGYQKATFILGSSRVIAFFTESNEFVGCIRDIFFDQLPITVMKAVDKRFPGADFQEVREITNEEGTSYLFVAQLDNKKYKVKINAAGSIIDSEKLSK